MTQILCVHGIAQQLRGEHSLAQSWVPSLLDGLNRASYRGSEPSVAIVFYGDLFRKPGTMTAQPLRPSIDVSLEGMEEELILSWWKNAAKTDPRVVPPEVKTMFRTPQLVQRALNALSASQFFSGLSKSLLRLFAQQVHLYFYDQELRAAVRDRLSSQVSEDTRILVGHSLGSVIAYEALCWGKDWPVRTFVSLGSPLGVPTIFERLQPTPISGKGVWPPGIIRWSNIADRGDCVALEKSLSACFGERVRDFLVHNDAKAHDVQPYLTSLETGRAIATGLCARD